MWRSSAKKWHMNEVPPNNSNPIGRTSIVTPDNGLHTTVRLFSLRQEYETADKDLSRSSDWTQLDDLCVKIWCLICHWWGVYILEQSYWNNGGMHRAARGPRFPRRLNMHRTIHDFGDRKYRFRIVQVQQRGKWKFRPLVGTGTSKAYKLNAAERGVKNEI